MTNLLLLLYINNSKGISKPLTNKSFIFRRYVNFYLTGFKRVVASTKILFQTLIHMFKT